MRASAADRVPPGKPELGLAEVVVAADRDPEAPLLRRGLAEVEQRVRNFDLVASGALEIKDSIYKSSVNLKEAPLIRY